VIFAGIDVNVITHEKALAAGIEAFGLWAWGMCYAQLHETDGRLPRIAVLSALAGKRNIMLAQRLVAAGLWTESEDGSWHVFNYRKKNQSADEIRKKKEAAAERARAWRERVRTRDGARDERVRTDPPPEPSPSPETPPPPSPENKTGESAPAPPMGLKRVLREDEPFTEKRAAYVETLHMSEGIRLDGPKVWRKFVNDRMSHGLLYGSTEQVDAAWRKWADAEVDIVKRDAAKDRERSERSAKRYADHTPKYERPTGEQAGKFQAELKRRLEEEAKKGAA
jgi:hypothetical protein